MADVALVCGGDGCHVCEERVCVFEMDILEMR